MVNAGGKTFVPSDLSVIVGVQVDEAGCNPQACGVDGFFGRPVDLTDVGDAPP